MAVTRTGERASAQRRTGTHADATGRLRRRLWSSAVLLAILLIAAILRWGWPHRAPPGLQVDEASNAWNARCFYWKGIDEHGKPWPVFYTGAFGDNRSPLYLYLLQPFIAIAGHVNSIVARQPAAFSGVLAVLLIYVVATALAGNPIIGLTAAGLLALAPWHVQTTRWGHEASIAPALVLLVLALLVWCGAPLGDNPRPLRWQRCLLAGVVVGAACYGYAAIRIYLPLLLMAAVLVNPRAWLRSLRQRGDRLAIGALALGLALSLGPLLVKHLTDPAMNARARVTWVWNVTDGPWQRLLKTAANYPRHFGPAFLFVHGSTDPSMMSPHGFGALHWYALPLILCGLAILLVRARRSAAARLTLVALLIYPAADLANTFTDTVNLLHCLPGMWIWPFIAAIGAASILTWLWTRYRKAAIAFLAALAIAIAFSNGLFLTRLLGAYDRDPAVYQVHNADVEQVCQYLKPRLRDIDAVFWTVNDRSFLYAPILVYLDYDPAQWFHDQRRVWYSQGPKFPGALLVLRFGKMWFMYPQLDMNEALNTIAADHPRPNMLAVIRPGEVPWLERTSRPLFEAINPDGRVSLSVYHLPLAPPASAPALSISTSTGDLAQPPDPAQ